MANLDQVILSCLPDLNKNYEITIPKWWWPLVLICRDILHGNNLELTARTGVLPTLRGAATGGRSRGGERLYLPQVRAWTAGTSCGNGGVGDSEAPRTLVIGLLIPVPVARRRPGFVAPSKPESRPLASHGRLLCVSGTRELLY